MYLHVPIGTARTVLAAGLGTCGMFAASESMVRALLGLREKLLPALPYCSTY